MTAIIEVSNWPRMVNLGAPETETREVRVTKITPKRVYTQIGGPYDKITGRDLSRFNYHVKPSRLLRILDEAGAVVLECTPEA